MTIERSSSLPEGEAYEQQGPVWELERVYEAFVDPVYRFIYRRVGNREDAEDLTAQVFLKAVRTLDRDRDEASIRGWLFQTARTTLADHWRQFYRFRSLPLELVPGLRQVEPPFSEPSTVSQTAAEVLARLPDNYRRVLALRFLERLSLRETAAELAITESNVKVLQYRALRRAAEMGRERR